MRIWESHANPPLRVKILDACILIPNGNFINWTAASPVAPRYLSTISTSQQDLRQRKPPSVQSSTALRDESPQAWRQTGWFFANWFRENAVKTGRLKIKTDMMRYDAVKVNGNWRDFSLSIYAIRVDALKCMMLSIRFPWSEVVSSFSVVQMHVWFQLRRVFGFGVLLNSASV